MRNSTSSICYRPSIYENEQKKFLDKISETAHFSIDAWIGHLQAAEYPPPGDNPIYKKILAACDLNFINKFINALSAEEAIAFADAVFTALPLDNPCLIIEGYALNRNYISGRLDALLSARNIKTWTLNPGNPPYGEQALKNLDIPHAGPIFQEFRK